MALNFPSSPSNGDIFDKYIYDSTKGVWKLYVTSSKITTIDDLSNVDVATAIAGDTLTYDGTNWIGRSLSQNYLLNGDFSIWQRGTSTSTSSVYLADRWVARWDAGTATVSRNTDIPSGIGTNYSLRIISTNGTNPKIYQRIESTNSLKFAGRTVTLSIWAKSTSGTVGLKYGGNYPGATDNWSTETVDVSGTFTATMSVGVWTLYTASFTVNALASRGYAIMVWRDATSTSTTTLFTGAQLELGSTATAFRTNTNNPEAELSACQRFFYRWNAEYVYEPVSYGLVYTSTAGMMPFYLPVSPRISPTVTSSNTFRLLGGSGTITTLGTVYGGVGISNPIAVGFSGTSLSGAGVITANNNAASYIDFEMEL